MNTFYSKIILSAFFTLAIIFNSGCGTIVAGTDPNRDRSQKAFNSADWKKGDAVERTRMALDVYRRRNGFVNGRSEKDLIEQFGEPDYKKESNGKTSWFYKLEEIRGAKPRLVITIVDGRGIYGLDGQGGEVMVFDN